jgi:hypothetical protein
VRRTLKHGLKQLVDQIVVVSSNLTCTYEVKILFTSFTDSEMRTVKLINLPTDATYSDVFSVVWGGEIQALNFTPGSTFAEVQFLKGEDCAGYFAATTNDIKWPKGPARFITVEKCEPEPTHDMVKGYIERGITRCVRVFDADQEWGKIALDKLAQGKTRRVIERIVNGQNSKGVILILA